MLSPKGTHFKHKDIKIGSQWMKKLNDAISKHKKAGAAIFHIR